MLIVDRQSRALQGELWHLVREVKGSDPLAPVTVVAPSQYAGLSLRQELGRDGFANVRFIILPVLAELLGGGALARAGRKPLPSLLESVWLRTALAERGGALGGVSAHSSTLTSLRASFADLRREGEDVSARLEEQQGVQGEVARLHSDFRRQISTEWYDPEDLAHAAADAVKGGETTALADLGAILFYLPHSVSPGERRLMETLAQGGKCSALIGLTGDDDADEPSRALAEALRPTLGVPQPANGGGGAAPGLPPGEARLHVAPTAHEELRWVIRRIVQEAEEGVPFHRMAVLYRIERPYASLALEELRFACIPTAGPDRETVAGTGVGRALLGLLELADGSLERANVMAWLTGCPVRPPNLRGAGFSPSRWDAITKRAGVVGGLEQWRSRLTFYAESQGASAAGGEQGEGVSEARAVRMRAEAGEAEQALAFVEGLAEAVEPPAEGSSWAAFCDWAVRLLDRYLARGLPGQEEAVRDKASRALEELRAADSIGRGTELSEFRQAVTEALRVPVGHQGATGQGVFVSSVGSAAGMTFDRVWFVGMIEGGMPPAVPPDPLLPEHDWHAAGGQSRLAQRVAAERYDYLSALATSEQREMSYPLADPGSQRKAYPSRWLLEQASALEGSRVDSETLPTLRDRAWLSVDESAEHALTQAQDSALADRHDYALQRLLRWRRANLPLREHPFAREGTLRRAALLIDGRSGSALTEYDGNLSAAAAEGVFERKLRESAMSATSLESWATCPFRYFLGHVLRLSGLDAPEDAVSITALERGSLMHTVLERFVKEADAAGRLPPPGEEWSEQSRRRLREIAEEEFRSAERRGVTGKGLLWSIEKQNILGDLETFLEEDAGLRGKHGTRRVLVEAGFDMGEDGLTVAHDATGVRFRGYIDRIDVSADGRSALVLDYKTGRADYYKALNDDPIDKGKRLQLGVYSLAARELAPDAERVEAAYWFVTTGGGFEFAPTGHFDIGDAETRQRFDDGLATITAGIRSGAFPANPGLLRQGEHDNCRYCDFNSLCPSGRAEAWERKQGDALLADYLELAGVEEEGEEAGE